MTTTHPVCFVDTETFGLDAQRHMIWEVAVIEPGGYEHLWHIDWPKPIIKDADPVALEMNGFNDRYRTADVMSPRDSASRFAELLEGNHMAGAVVSFDEERLRQLHNNTLGRPAGRYPWHYHIIDVEALAIGYLATPGPGPYVVPPWKSDELSEALGVEAPEGDVRHTALADARWAAAIYEAVMFA